MSDIKYEIVKQEDIHGALLASSTSTTAGRKVKKNDSIVWNQTVAIIMERVDLEGINRDTSKEGIQAIGKTLKELMAKHILAEVTIPEDGKDRDGKSFKVCDKEGTPKWSSWDQTRRIWAYLGDIAKVLAHSQESILYPEKYKVGSRCEVLKLCKVPEGTLKAIDRLSEALQDQLDVVSNPGEVLHAHKAVSSLVVNNLSMVDEAQDLIKRLDALMSCAEGEEKEQMKTSFSLLVPHFK